MEVGQREIKDQQNLKALEVKQVGSSMTEDFKDGKADHKNSLSCQVCLSSVPVLSHSVSGRAVKWKILSIHVSLIIHIFPWVSANL